MNADITEIRFSSLQGMKVPGMEDVRFAGAPGQAHAHALRLIETRKSAREVEFFTLSWPRAKDQLPKNSNLTWCQQSYHHTGRPVGCMKHVEP